MGDSSSKYYEDYADYRDFCESLNIPPKGRFISFNGDFYKHQRDLLKDLGFKSLYEYYENLKVIQNRDIKITQILE